MAWLDALDAQSRRDGFEDVLTIDRQEISGTPISVNLDADALGSYADATPDIDRRGIHRFDLSADALGSYTDDTPTIDRRGIHRFDISADALGSYADTPLVIDFRGNQSFAVTSDAWETLADELATAVSELLPLVIDIPADAWETLADGIAGFHTFAAKLGDDANVSYIDIANADLWRLGYIDSLIIDKQDVGIIPITADIPADGWETIADSAPTIDLHGLYLVEPDADDFNLWADEKTIDRQEFTTPIASEIPADAWESLADSGPTIDLRGSYFLALTADDLNVWDDAKAIDRQELGSTPIPVALSDDALGGYADIAPTVDRRGNHAIQPTSDALGSYADAAPSIDRRGNHIIQPSADALGSYADAVPTIDFRGNRLLSLAADPWETLADSLAATAAGTLPLTANLAADALGSYADALAVRRALFVNAIDGWGQRAVAIPVTLSDAKPAFSDSVAGAAAEFNQKTVQLSDANAAYGDSVGVTLGLRFDVHEPTIIEWTWTDQGGGTPDGFRIYYGHSSGNPTGYYQIADPDARSVSIVTAIPPGEWIVWATAYNTDGESAVSNEITVSYYIYGDSLIFEQVGRDYALTDQRPAITDALAVRFALLVTESDAKADLADAISNRTAIPVVFEADSIGTYADSLIGTSDLRAALSDALAAYADELVAQYTHNIEQTDNAEFAADAKTIVVGSYVQTAITVNLEADSLSAYGDSAAQEVWGVENYRYDIADDLTGEADELLGTVAYGAEIADDALTVADALAVDRQAPGHIPVDLTDDLTGYVDSVGGIQAILADCSADTYQPQSDALALYEGGLLFEFFRLRELRDRYALTELKERYRLREHDTRYASKETG